jgi:hypothetical protein
MNRSHHWILWGILCVALILANGPAAVAQDDFGLPDTGLDDSPAPSPAEAPDDGFGSPPADDAGSSSADGNITPGMDEAEQIDNLANKFKFKPIRASKDPFRPLVQKQVVLPPVVQTRPGPSTPAGPPPPPPPKPIQLTVQGVVGNDSERLALIVFENKPYTVQKDTVVDGKFKVVEILPDRLVVYSNKEQMRRTFNLAPGKD